MTKNSIISRILAVAVFFMGVTIGVAQEQSAANGNAEVLESVEAMALAATVVKVNTESAERQAKLIAAKAEVMKEPQDNGVSSSKTYVKSGKRVDNATGLSYQWFEYVASDHPADYGEATTPGNYSPVGSADPDATLCGGATNLCAIWAETNGSNEPIIATDAALQTAISNYFLNVVDRDFLREKNP